MGGPRDVVVGVLSVLLASQIGGEGLGLDRVGSEEEELLGGDQVPVAWLLDTVPDVSGEVRSRRR